MITLNEVQKNFRAWRDNRRHPKEKIPDELWQQVACLLPSYSGSVICNKLGILKRQLDANITSDGFASYQLPCNPVEHHDEGNCEVHLERGSSRLMIKVPMTQFDHVLSKLVDYLRVLAASQRARLKI